MSVILAEGFENIGGSYEQFDLSLKYPGSSGDAVRYTGRHGGSSKLVKLGSANGKIVFIHSTELTTFTMGVAVAIDDILSSVVTCCEIMDGSANGLYRIRTFQDRSIAVLTWAGSTLARTPANTIPNAAFFYLEVQMTVGGSGSVIIRINGLQKATFSGNTGSTTAIQRIQMIRADNSAVSITDWYILDSTGPNNNFLGDCRVQDFLPTSDGTDNDFTASAGNRFQCVDETLQNGDTDYVYSSTAGNKQTFNMADISTTGTIVAVISTVYVRKDDAGSRSFKHRTRSGATVSDATEISINNSNLAFQRIEENDPNTGLAWLQAGFNAAEFGVLQVT
jgi:hypothetical protein